MASESLSIKNSKVGDTKSGLLIRTNLVWLLLLFAFAVQKGWYPLIIALFK